MRRTHALLTGIAIVLLCAGCGGSGGTPKAASGSSAPPSGRRATNAGVSIVVPSGWEAGSLQEPPGLVLAANKADLSAAVPNGPRLEATLAGNDDPSPSDLIAGIDQASIVGSVETAETTIGGQPAVSVEFTQTVAGTTETTRTVVATIGPGQAYTFTLEAPQTQWQTNLSTLEGALGTTMFDTSTIPASH